MTAGHDRGTAVVPAITTGSSLACLRSLGRAGVRTIAVGDTKRIPAFRSRYCDERVLAPSPREDLAGYADALVTLAARPATRAVVPLRESDIYVLAKHRKAFAEHIATPWPDWETVRTVQDRLALVEAADAAGVVSPATDRLDEWDDWDGRTVIKPRYSILVEGNGSFYPDVRLVERGVEPAFEDVVAEMGHVPIVQEFVPGEEYGFFALCDRGEPVVTFQHRRIRSYTYAGGASVFRKSVRIPELAAAGTRLLRHLDWHGPAMVEFKRDERTGAFTLIEVNPRFWGSLPLAVHAGVDFPHQYYRLATGALDSRPNEYAVGVGSHVLVGECSYLNSVWSHEYAHVPRPAFGTALVEVARSLYRHPNFDLASRDDPRPFVRHVANLTRDAVRSMVGR